MRPFPLTRRSLLGALALCLAAGAGLHPAPASAAETITVFAAASLKNAMDEITADWKAETGNIAHVSFAGSSTLARQIAQGAPAQVFISANVKWMDYVQKAGKIVEPSRHDLLGNALVMVAPKARAQKVDIAKGFDLSGMLGDRKLAMAMVDSVPAGIYGKQALTSLGVWDAVQPKVAQASDVRGALALVSRGEAPYGIVYATDAAAEPKVAVVGTFPEDSHVPIIYPAAAMKGAPKAATQFLAYLSGAKAKAAFLKQGFTVLVK